MFLIGVMTCSACSARVEKAALSVYGVQNANVNLLMNTLSVEGGDDKKIMEAVKKAGYKIEPYKEKAAEEEERPEKPMIKRLLISSAVLLVLMYFSMGYTMMSFPLPNFLSSSPFKIAVIEAVLTLIVLVINKNYFINGVKGVLNKSANMDTLVSLGSGVSFIWSLWYLYLIFENERNGYLDAAQHFLHSLYFESAAMIVTLITIGKTLEAKAKGKTTDAIKGLSKLQVKTITVLVDGKEEERDILSVKKGDIFAVKPGQSIPTDGIILEGTSSVNEAALTGESIPADKKEGDEIFSGTVNLSGYLKCEATGSSEDTLLSKIIKTVTDAAATKAPIARLADKVSGIFVPVVIGIALLTLIVWMAVNSNFSHALTRAISVLVISCPCALGLATPVAVTVGHGVGAKNGILFKTAEAIETAGKTEIVVLDKTGTITKGEPEVTDIIPFGNKQELIDLSYALEKRSEHPLSLAIVKTFQNEIKNEIPVEDFEAVSGKGVKGYSQGKALFGGSFGYINGIIEIPDEIKEKGASLSEEGKTPLYFIYENRLLGLIAVADVIRDDSIKAISEMKKMGLSVVMLTGDNEKTANAIGKKVGVDNVISEVLPTEKQNAVADLQKTGKTAMVGDGINDAPALTKADLGIAIGAGTDIAIDSADVVLMKNRLSDVPALLRLSKGTLKNIHENLFWAFFYNVLCIPLAAGAFTPLFGWELNPMVGALAMSLSSFCVVMNALRLKRIKIYK